METTSSLRQLTLSLRLPLHDDLENEKLIDCFCLLRRYNSSSEMEKSKIMV